ncbi:hypothetical protein GPECTOR_44g15 [Gonium pectorale]|uniref:Uncharacterized protein n=1 Tax=Gonium pectorale TaxID=33097 RepID=A0A150G902_GONPE|nr:hypothetical protein GPECTOR_44g15 [Gonium pectorale]|eukprot:KXZ46336.1 hypothetical protein GPECTOR_44g15 [Gonium pectorale]
MTRAGGGGGSPPLLERLELHGNPGLRDVGLLHGVLPLLEAVAASRAAPPRAALSAAPPPLPLPPPPAGRDGGGDAGPQAAAGRRSSPAAPSSGAQRQRQPQPPVLVVTVGPATAAGEAAWAVQRETVLKVMSAAVSGWARSGAGARPGSLLSPPPVPTAAVGQAAAALAYLQVVTCNDQLNGMTAAAALPSRDAAEAKRHGDQQQQQVEPAGRALQGVVEASDVSSYEDETDEGNKRDTAAEAAVITAAAPTAAAAGGGGVMSVSVCLANDVHALALAVALLQPRPWQSTAVGALLLPPAGCVDDVGVTSTSSPNGESCPQVQALDLSTSQVGSAGVAAICAALRHAPALRGLRRLVLKGVVDAAGDELLIELAGTLTAAAPHAGHLRRLELIDVQGADGGGGGFVLGGAAAEALVKALHRMAEEGEAEAAAAGAAAAGGGGGVLGVGTGPAGGGGEGGAGEQARCRELWLGPVQPSVSLLRSLVALCRLHGDRALRSPRSGPGGPGVDKHRPAGHPRRRGTAA